MEERCGGQRLQAAVGQLLAGLAPVPGTVAPARAWMGTGQACCSGRELEAQQARSHLSRWEPSLPAPEQPGIRGASGSVGSG